MKQIGYKQFIMEHVVQYPDNTPLFSSEIAEILSNHFKIEFDHARTLVNVNLPRIASSCNLMRFSKGIYYKPLSTVFGFTKLNPAVILRDQYLRQEGKVIGYETGAGFLNRIGLTTQVPKYKKYATNRFKQNGSRLRKRLMARLKKPAVQVNEGNVEYLQLLDAIANKDKVSIEVPDQGKVILDYINKQQLDFQKLVGIARKYYNKKTQEKLFEIATIGVK